MREIKFRAWDGECMFLNEDIGDDFDFQLSSLGLSLLVNEMFHECGSGIAEEYWQYVEEEDVVFMQFTGIKDINGVDIYEGDIVDDSLLGVCEVKYNDTHAAFKVLHKNKRTAKWFVDYLPNEFNYLTVIGNIHENQDLLTRG